MSYESGSLVILALSKSSVSRPRATICDLQDQQSLSCLSVCLARRQSPGRVLHIHQGFLAQIGIFPQQTAWQTAAAVGVHGGQQHFVGDRKADLRNVTQPWIN